MSRDVYIRAASCISPQQTFGAADLPAEIKPLLESKLTAVEPDYKTHLNIPAARRMSRLIKMGVCSALQCLKDADVKVPDAVICGTGLGCMEDSEKFLASLIENNEQTLSPTSFIFSTHNTVAAQVALLLQCNNYNFTHTHRGLSFENALLDALLFLGDHPGYNVLVGATDEVTPTSYKILERLGNIKREAGADLFSGSTAGTIAGEGSVFFNLTDTADLKNLARIREVYGFSNPSGEEEISGHIDDFIRRNKISSADFILFGQNGDMKGDAVYTSIRNKHFSSSGTGMFKHLCGEYHTATAFATWLGAMVLRSGKLPDYLVHTGTRHGTPGRILIFNHYKGREFSLILLEKC